MLILSNLLEYANNSGHLVQARNNIESLLKDEGIAICTSMLHKRNSYAHKKEIAILTSHLLEVNGIHHTYYEPLAGKCLDLAYSYRLKKK